MVWEVPDGVARARQDLIEMAEAGVEAVRTGWIDEPELLDLADTLGLQLYVDLPVTRLPARRLLDTLAFAVRLADAAGRLAAAHPSVRAIGLAQYIDTSDSTACRYFSVLSDLVKRAAPGTRTYYVTRFVEQDACAPSVDLVLVNLIGRANPAAALRGWDEGNRTPLGIAALGTWVRSDSLRGLHVPGSPERQARYLEEHLSNFLGDGRDPGPGELAVVFVYRWRDVWSPLVSTSENLTRPMLRPYGLHGADGLPRPAYRVVSGIYTGRQTVFAFEPGREPSPSAPWSVLVGWAVLLVLGAFYALSPRFRHMVPRYFQAHFFFREAVREGRDVLFGASVVLLASLGAACGLVWYVVVDAVRASDPFVLIVQWLPVPTQHGLAGVLAQPPVFVVLVGCLYVLGLLVWTLVLSLFSRRKYRLAPAQVLMLVLWPRWPQLFVMMGAMVTAGMEAPGIELIAGLAAAWVLFSVTAVVRTLVDLLSVTRVAGWVLIPAALAYPGLLLAGAAAFLILSYRPEAEYVVHLITRR